MANIALVLTLDIEKLLDQAKRVYYNRTQSDMIRALILAGLERAQQIGTYKTGMPRL